MSSDIYAKSFNTTAKRLAASAGKIINPLVPQRHESLGAPVWDKRRVVQPQGTASLGQTVTYKLPTTGFLGTIFLNMAFAKTSTAGMVNYPGAAAVQRVRLQTASQTLIEYDYQPVFQYYLSWIERDAGADVLVSAGNTDANNPADSSAVKASVPIFTPFDERLAPHSHANLNLNKINEPIQLEITFRPAADLGQATATGMALTQANLAVFTYSTVPEVINALAKDDYVYSSFDIQTSPNVDVATATETELDVSGFSGNLKFFYFSSRKKSVVDGTGADRYFQLVETDKIVRDIDGDRENIFETKEEGRLLHLYDNEGIGSSSLGVSYMDDLDYGTLKSGGRLSDNTGGINSSAFNKFVYRVTQSTGSNAYVNALAFKTCQFAHKNGALIKIN